MKFIFTLITVVFLWNNLFAQDQFSKADSIAASVNASEISTLHSQLTKNLTSDSEKIRAFYSWIANNINYDVNESLKASKDYRRQEPQVVLKSRKAICHGYAAVFRELCNLSNIPCFMVSGYTRVGGKFDNSGHSWNVVFLNNKWQHVDVTWGAGGVDDRGVYTRQINNYFFLTNPKEFLADHYPFDPMWQLVTLPVNASTFKNAKFIYQESTTPYFNFNDTISTWLKYDSLEREYTSTLRMVRFNPNDDVVKQQLSYALFLKGNAEFENGNKIMIVLFPKDQKIIVHAYSDQEFSKRMAQMDSVILHYKNAETFYKQVKLAKASDQAVLKENLESLKFNMDVVIKEQMILKAEH